MMILKYLLFYWHTMCYIYIYTHIHIYAYIYMYMYIVKALVVQLYLTLCDPIDCSPPGSSIHGILQTRILEWVAIPFSRGSSRPRNWIQVTCFAGRFFTSWATGVCIILLVLTKVTTRLFRAMYNAKKTVLYSSTDIYWIAMCSALCLVSNCRRLASGHFASSSASRTLSPFLILVKGTSLLMTKLYSLGLARGSQSQGLLGIDAFGLPGTVAPGEI